MARYRTVGLFILLSVIWGLSFVASRAAVQNIPPMLLAAIRFDIAGLVVLGYAVSTTEQWRPRSRADWVVIGLGATFFVALHHAFLYAGQQYVTSAVAGSIISLDPILAAAFARVLLPEHRISMTGSVGLGLGILGVGIIADPDPGRLLSADVRGVILVFLAAAAFALGAVLTERFRTELPVQSMQAWMMILGASMLHIASFTAPSSISALQWTTSALIGLAYLALVAGGAGYLLYFELLDQVGSVEINLVGYTAPVFAAIGGWLFLGEALDLGTAIGFCSIVIGFVLIKRDAFRAEMDDFFQVIG